MKNLGKRFEENFKFSCPENAFFYRFRDSGSTFYGGNNQLRFSTSNIADNLIFVNNTLYLNELKHHLGKSIPLECIIGKNNKTKQKQISDLLDASKYDGVKCNIIVFFSDVERCFALEIHKFKEFMDNEDRKSIPLAYFEENAVEIGVRALKMNHRFDLSKWLGDDNDADNQN